MRKLLNYFTTDNHDYNKEISNKIIQIFDNIFNIRIRSHKINVN